MKEQLSDAIITMADRALQLASMQAAISDAVTYSPDDLSQYSRAIELVSDLLCAYAADMISMRKLIA